MPPWLTYLTLLVGLYFVIGIAITYSGRYKRLIDRHWRDAVANGQVDDFDAMRVLFTALWIIGWPKLFFLGEPPVNGKRSDAAGRGKKPVRKNQRRR